jgi:cytoskeleton protein RodZ
MRTVGIILKQARIEKGVSLEEIAARTKIRLKYLEALEADNYKLLPSVASARGFIKNYADFLELNPESLLAIFKRDFPENEKTELLPQGLVRTPGGNRFVWTPKLTAILAVIIASLLFLGYLAWQYSFLARTPYR